jgi:hypothetical protein
MPASASVDRRLAGRGRTGSRPGPCLKSAYSSRGALGQPSKCGRTSRWRHVPIVPSPAGPLALPLTQPAASQRSVRRLGPKCATEWRNSAVAASDFGAGICRKPGTFALPEPLKRFRIRPSRCLGSNVLARMPASAAAAHPDRGRKADGPAAGHRPDGSSFSPPRIGRAREIQRPGRNSQTPDVRAPAAVAAGRSRTALRSAQEVPGERGDVVGRPEIGGSGPDRR